ncbi:MAG TPA: HyaD/HybD family hydrogenase maturation endopeptidase [Gemmatimonadota bacterium]|nr:HyaD/HybD family hydrogenase maturation endopeptidase [Gemmatimonadota bacterium]
MTGGGRAPTLVVGLGNPLMTDDGIGLAALARLDSEWELPEGVELVDGGIWGLRLLPEIEDAGRLLLIDAIDVDRRAGEVIVLEIEEIPMFLSSKLSPHQVGIRDVLALAALRGRLPAETVAMGIQPARIEMGTEISDEAKASMDALLERVVSRLAEWNLPPRLRASEAACTR